MLKHRSNTIFHDRDLWSRRLKDFCLGLGVFALIGGFVLLALHSWDQELQQDEARAARAHAQREEIRRQVAAEEYGFYERSEPLVDTRLQPPITLKVVFLPTEDAQVNQ